MYTLARQLLFKLSPETSHDLSLDLIGAGGRLGLNGLLTKAPASLPVTVMGLNFANPVGLAAGLDKNGAAIDGFAQLGFGFVEIGTVTPRPQPGNPKPRLFRLPEAEAIINRMGFNNLGVDNLLNRVRAAKYRGILGINIGKNFDTPVERAVDDYLICLDKVYDQASYITVNVSSPNTPGLRSLQFGDSLKQLLDALAERRSQLVTERGKHVPLAIKIAPDMSDEETVLVASALVESGMDAVIATTPPSAVKASRACCMATRPVACRVRRCWKRARISSRCWPASWAASCRSLPQAGLPKASMRRRKLPPVPAWYRSTRGSSTRARP